MPPPLSVDNFLATLQKSNLLSPEQWTEFRALLHGNAPPADAATIALTVTPRHASTSAAREHVRAPASPSSISPASASLASVSTEPQLAASQPSDAHLVGSHDPLDVPDLIQWLIARHFLTRWQADMLLTGRKAFFLGNYKLLDRVGVGGMGAVFKAEHVGLGRTVAIKIMSPALVRNKAAIARFYREMQAAAALNHPNIVLAFDAGALGDTYFLVMEFVDGADLGTLVDRGASLPIGWACECIRQAALGLQHAFEQGMVHRDIKPSNLLVTRDPDSDRPLVKVLDMGLARFVSESGDDSGLTQTGQVLGTPDYISPEQAADTRHADIRSDIFSLGITFFRLLTGKLPFKGENVMEKLMARAMVDAPLIRTLRPDVSPALEAVIARMLARDIRQRYQTPRDVVHALTPFAMPAPLTQLLALAAPGNEATRASAPGETSPPDLGLERFLKQLATEAERGEAGELLRDDAQSGLRSTARSIDGTTTAAPKKAKGLSTIPAPAIAKVNPAEARRWLARASRRTIVFSVLGAGLLTLVAATWINGRTTARAELIFDWPPRERSQSHLTINEQPISIPLRGEFKYAAPPGTWTVRVARRGYEPIETTLTLRLNEQRTWTPAWRDSAELTRHTQLERLRQRVSNGPSTDPAAPGTVALRNDLVQFIHHHPGSPEAIAAAQLLPRLVWPLDELQRSQIPPAELQTAGFGNSRYALRELVAVWGDSRLKHWNRIYDVAISADSRLLAAASHDGTIKIWEIATGKDLQTMLVGDSQTALLFSPVGHLLATHGESSGTILWDALAGRLQVQLGGMQRPLAFSPDGQLLAGVGRRRRLGLWRVPTGEERTSLPAQDAVRRGVFSPNGRWLAAESRAGLQVFEIETARPVHQFPQAATALFAPDSTRLAAATQNSSITVWEPVSGQVQQVLEDAGEPLGFSPDNHVLASARYGRVILWDVETGNELNTLLDLNGLTRISPNGLYVADADDDFGWLKFRQTATGETRPSTGHPRAISCLTYSPDSSILATGSADHTIKFWHPATGAERVVAGAGIVAADLSPDGRLLAVATEDGSIRLREIQSGRISRVLQDAARRIETVRFSPNGQLLAAVGDWGVFQVSLRLWETASGRELDLIGDQPGAVQALAFSPDSKSLAVAGITEVVAIWDLESRHLRSSLPENSGRIHALAFSPDRQSIAVAGDGGRTRVWDLHTSDLRFNLNSPATAIFALAYSPDGRSLAQTGPEEHVFLWDLQASPPRPRILSAPGSATRSLSFRLDGQYLAAASQVGKVHLWQLSADALNPAPVQTLALGPPGGIVEHVLFSPEGRHLLTCNGNGTVYVLRLASSPDDGRQETSPPD